MDETKRARIRISRLRHAQFTLSDIEATLPMQLANPNVDGLNALALAVVDLCETHRLLVRLAIREEKRRLQASKGTDRAGGNVSG